MPKKNGGRGDLLIHFSVQFPESMGEENVQALQKLLGGEEKMEVTEDVCEKEGVADEGGSGTRLPWGEWDVRSHGR